MEKRTSNLHSNFFSSLKQVEKRLKLENSSVLQINHASFESLSTPLYLYVEENDCNSNAANDNKSDFGENSETPVEFLSNSIDFPQTDENPLRECLQNDAHIVSCGGNGGDEVGGLLVQNIEIPVEFPKTDKNPPQKSPQNDAHIVSCVENNARGIGLLMEDSETPVEFPKVDKNPPRKYPQNDAHIVNCVEENVGGIGLLIEDSETPVEFLSNSIDFPQTHENPPLKALQNDAQMVSYAEDNVDVIGLLIELLGLSEREEEEWVNMTCLSCHCGGGFYEKVVGMKGPKCGKEMERLNGWVKHFGDEKIEPFRLVHLLLGKATCIKGDGDGGFEAVKFPSTVEEFLQHDPPIMSMPEGISGG